MPLQVKNYCNRQEQHGAAAASPTPLGATTSPTHQLLLLQQGLFFILRLGDAPPHGGHLWAFWVGDLTRRLKTSEKSNFVLKPKKPPVIHRKCPAPYCTCQKNRRSGQSGQSRVPRQNDGNKSGLADRCPLRNPRRTSWSQTTVWAQSRGPGRNGTWNSDLSLSPMIPMLASRFERRSKDDVLGIVPNPGLTNPAQLTGSEASLNA